MVVSSRSIDDCAIVAQQIEKSGGSAIAIAADVSDLSSMQGMVDEIKSRFSRLDVAFNNAGDIVGGQPLHDVDTETMERMFAANSTGVFNSLKAEIPLMKEGGGGAIVVNSAGAGLRARPFVAPYAASKWAAIGFAVSSAAEVGGDNIRINVIAPGYIGTEAWVNMLGGQADELAQKVPLKRIGEPEEVANAVTWLLSDASSYISGAVIPIDGGLLSV